MRTVFFGTPDVAVPALRTLADAGDVDVLAAVTNPDRPRGRSRTPVAPPVKDAATELGIDVWQPDRGRDVAAALAAAAPDVCAVVAYGSILPASVLALAGHGFVNLHFSLLPRWRGAAPVQHAIRAGDDVTGVTTFVLDAGMDTGPILTSAPTPIAPDETAGQLLARLAEWGAPILLESLRDLVGGATPRPQPDSGVTLAPKVHPGDVAIDFARPANRVAALVRSAAPRPGAHTTWRGQRFKLLDATVEPASSGPSGARPGELLVADPGGLVIACRDGALRTTRVQPAGKPVLGVADFVNGHRPRIGTRFGTTQDDS